MHIYSVHINTNIYMYIFNKNAVYIFIYNIKYNNIFQIYTVCVYLYITNTNTQYTHIFCK